MAARISFLFALGAPLCRAGPYYTPPDIDFSKVEFWPLSGGVADGVSVDFTAAGLKDGEDAVIDFVTADYEVAFRWQMNKVTRVIERTSWENDAWVAAESRGGWPIQDGVAFALSFTRTLNHWAITVDGTRMPWFDFQHSTAFDGKDVVYAAVHIGFMDGEVVDKRKVCGTVCDVEECVGAYGGSTCTDGTCYSRTPIKDNETYTVSCSSATTTGLEGQACCDGRRLNYIDSDASLVDSWVRVFDSNAAVKAAASSFGSPVTDAQISVALGNKVGIKSFDSATELYTVYVPQLHASGAQEIQLPGDVMQTSEQRACIMGPGTAGTVTLKETNGLITSPGSGSWYQWWFLNLWDIGPYEGTPYQGRDGIDWWISYSDANKANFNTRGRSYLLVDEDVGHTTCTDVAADIWTDQQGASCADYTEGGWCEDHGIATQAFIDAKSGLTGCTRNCDQLWRSDVASADGGWHAAEMCCSCGGGIHDPPDAPSCDEAEVAAFFQ